MAYGFTPQYTEQVPFDGLTQQQFVALCMHTAEKMKWNILYKSTAGLMAYTGTGMFRTNAKVTILADEGFATIKSESTGSEMFDLGRNKKVALAFIDSMNSVKQTTTPAALDEQYAALAPNLPPPQEDTLINPSLGKLPGGAWSIFIPRKGYLVTPLIVDINILIFILMVISGAGFLQPSNESLIAWGANYTPLTLGGQWWRLVTNTFEHIGVLHLLFNMYAFVYIGMLLEPMLGEVKFAVAYLLTGILASLASLWWHDITISAGASGAIFGMYGVFLAMLTTNFIEKSKRKPLLTSIGIFVVYNLAYGTKGNIDNSAHIGGLLSGIVIGYLYFIGLRKPLSTSLGNGILAAVIVLCLTASVVIYKNIPNDIAAYEEKMDTFSVNEKAALAFFAMPGTPTKADSLTALSKTGIPDWKENIKLLYEIKRLRVSGRFKEQADMLLDYSNYRLASFQLMYKAVSENSGRYNDSINYYNSQVQEAINRLKGKASEK